MCDENTTKFKNLQLERLKREDDEEQWISGEELCTEGSSDEETTSKKCKNKSKSKTKLQTKIKNPTKDLIQTTNITPEIKTTDDNQVDKTDKGETEKGLDASIQWRPKRGSIKLPIHEGEKVEMS